MTAKEQEQMVSRRGRRAWLRYVLMLVVIVVVVGGMAAATFYEREIRVFFTLQAWRGGAAAQVVKDFVSSIQKGDVQAALALVDPASNDPIEENGKIVGLQRKEPSGLGRFKVYFDKLVSPGEFEVKSVGISHSDGGGFTVLVRFSDHTEGWFVVKRFGSDFKITILPQIPGKYHF